MSTLEEPIAALDGTTHIRIHARGKTLLGRLLCNAAHTPFDHPVYGRFESLEGFWLWNRSGRVEEALEDAQSVYGAVSVIKTNQVLFSRVQRKGFRKEIAEALRFKIEQNPRLLELLRESNLKFLRYEVTDNGLYPTTVVIEEQAWFLKELTTYRMSLRRKAVAA